MSRKKIIILIATIFLIICGIAGVFAMQRISEKNIIIEFLFF